MNNLKQENYSAPEVKTLHIITERLCISSVNETANHESYESIDLFE